MLNGGVFDRLPAARKARRVYSRFILLAQAWSCEQRSRSGGWAPDRAGIDDLVSGGNQSDSQGISAASQAASEFGAAAGRVLPAAADVSKQAEALSGEVNIFVAR